MIRLELRVYFSGSTGARIFLHSCLDPDAAPDAPKIQHTNTQNSLLARNLGDIFDCSITSTQNSLLAGCMWRAGGVPGVRMASMRTTCEHARQPRVCECRQDYQEPEFETVGACLIMLHDISHSGANFECWYVECLGHQEQHGLSS